MQLSPPGLTEVLEASARLVALVDMTFALVDEGQQHLERLGADALERVGGVRRVAHARLEEVEEVLRARGEGHPVGLELDALSAEGEVGEPRLSRQRPASAGWCGTPPCSVSLVAAVAGCEEDEALARPARRCARASAPHRGSAGG